MSQPMPFFAPTSTEQRMLSFDENIYTADSSTLIYKLVDAICGSTGAGLLISQTMLNILQGALDTTYGSDLDYFFGNIGFLPRSPAESYPYDPAQHLLTAPEWDEVTVKDAWYRARIKDFWAACQLGGTPEGIRMAVQAALATDCTIFEVWRYIDNFGIGNKGLGFSGGSPGAAVGSWNAGNLAAFGSTTGISLGRAPSSARNEVVIRPSGKTTLTPQELRLVRDMLTRIMPVDVIVTVNAQGLAAMSPVSVCAATSNSTYYEVQKMVTATPVLANMPPPELLPIDLLPTETWLYSAQDTPTLAPYAQFNISAQFGYYYLLEGGSRSPIDSVTYGTLQPDGTVAAETNFTTFIASGNFTPWRNFDLADSPDNYPGGRFGQHPNSAPALSPDGTAYQFPWSSQADFVAAESANVVSLGGNVTDTQYQLPITSTNESKIVFYPEYAVAYYPPGKDSTVSSSITRYRPNRAIGLWTNPASFVRS